MSDETKNLILGITTVGDLLVTDKISKANKNGEKIELIDNINLKIPDYQRPYKWTAKNANQLLDDIIQAMTDKKEVYRVGTLILHHDEKGNYNIVDGQQRTITFALLLKVLDKETNFLNEELYPNEYSLHNIKSNYWALKRRLSAVENKTALLDYINKKCELIVVITEDIKNQSGVTIHDGLSEAFQFFDSQNARGKALYPHDLLKAYHLREMKTESEQETEKLIKIWEDSDQKELSALFSEYLYRLKEWIKENRSDVLNEKNIDLFKGITSEDNHPYAQYFKGAFAYADNLNRSALPFVTGSKLVKPFQINTPIIAGKPFFEYAKHYFDLLADIRDNDKYKGYFINGKDVVYTLDKYFCKRVGDKITRLMFDTAILLYVDRFCPVIPNSEDLEIFDTFVNHAFVWAYSMRAQYHNVGWLVAQNYILGNGVKNSFNIYKMIVESDTPSSLISKLADNLLPLNPTKANEVVAKSDELDKKDNEGVFENYLHFFKENNYWEGK